MHKLRGARAGSAEPATCRRQRRASRARHCPFRNKTGTAPVLTSHAVSAWKSARHQDSASSGTSESVHSHASWSAQKSALCLAPAGRAKKASFTSAGIFTLLMSTCRAGSRRARGATAAGTESGYCQPSPRTCRAQFFPSMREGKDGSEVRSG